LNTKPFVAHVKVGFKRLKVLKNKVLGRNLELNDVNNMSTGMEQVK
jgi:hypothetical protein